MHSASRDGSAERWRPPPHARTRSARRPSARDSPGKAGRPGLRLCRALPRRLGDILLLQVSSPLAPWLDPPASTGGYAPGACGTVSAVSPLNWGSERMNMQVARKIEEPTGSGLGLEPETILPSQFFERFQ